MLLQTQSERALMVRQVADQPRAGMGSSKDNASDRGAALYAVAGDEGSDGAYVIDQHQPAPQITGGRYPELPGGNHQGANPYQSAYSQSPGGRYATTPWQPNGAY